MAITHKYTTGEPNYIEVAHLEPAKISEGMLKRVKEIVFHALNSLGIQYGASHTELKINREGKIVLIEILALERIQYVDDRQVTDSSNRFGYFIIQATERDVLERYMPSEEE